MAVVAVGINERDVSLDVFEQSAISERDLPKALHVLCESEHISEAVVLSTCLRTEVYAVVERFHDGLADIESFFRSYSAAMGTDSEVLSELLSCWVDDAAVSHLFEVAAGIDSPVLGEGEILRQVRTAAELARHEHAAGLVLGPLFRHAVEAGKRVRTETAIAQGTTSLAHAAVALAAGQLEGGLVGRTVLVIGAGEMGAGFSKALAQPMAPARVVVANRSAERAASCSARSGVSSASTGSGRSSSSAWATSAMPSRARRHSLPRISERPPCSTSTRARSARRSPVCRFATSASSRKSSAASAGPSA